MKRKILGLAATLGLFAAATASAQSVKWHPGHYVMLPGGDSDTTIMRNIDEIGSVGPIKGVMIRMWWSDLEPYKGTYNFSKIDRYLNRLKSQPSPKRLVVRIMDRRFNTWNKDNIVPDYLRTSTYNGGLVRTKSGYAARLWESAVMDRYIALLKAMGRRYDSNVYFEGIATEESTLGIKDFPSGYSHQKLKDQWNRMIRNVKPVMPHTNLFFYANWIGSESLMESLVDGVHDNYGAGGGSNTIPNYPTLAQRVYRGDTGGPDYRGTLPIAASVETDVLGGNNGWFTPKQINDYAYSYLKLNHMFWVRNTWQGGKAQRWDTGILPFLKGNPPIRTNCPARYPSCAR